jgi:hypothetical protein
MSMNVGNTSTYNQANTSAMVVSKVSLPNNCNQIWGHNIFATNNDGVQL